MLAGSLRGEDPLLIGAERSFPPSHLRSECRVPRDIIFILLAFPDPRVQRSRCCTGIAGRRIGGEGFEESFELDARLTWRITSVVETENKHGEQRRLFESRIDYPPWNQKLKGGKTSCTWKGNNTTSEVITMLFIKWPWRTISTWPRDSRKVHFQENKPYFKAPLVFRKGTSSDDEKNINKQNHALRCQHEFLANPDPLTTSRLLIASRFCVVVLLFRQKRLPYI